MGVSDRVFTKREWQPKPEGQKILDYAMVKIKSVPYKPSSRWTFYRVVQDGLLLKSQIAKFDYLTSRARKSFYKEWRPDSLTDSIRQLVFRGEFNAVFNVEFDSIADQEYYVQLWFEAQAMYQQFDYHTKDYRVSLLPFRGDCSIAAKWDIAKKLEKAYEKYEKPIKILYFGDCDKKGIQIPKAAAKDIQNWCRVPFDVEHVGLTEEQARDFGLPENPEKRGNFQWEAVEDEDAKKLILESLSKYQHPFSQFLKQREEDVQDKVRTAILEVLHAELGDAE
jgi:hypothetical protein